MKKIILTILVLVSYYSFAQNANLDREYFKVSYVKLPSKPILDNSKRTFSTNNNSVAITGFSRVSTGGSLEINSAFSGTKTSIVDIKETKKENKDKEGNITSTTYHYSIVAIYKSSGYLKVDNYLSGDNYYKTYNKTSTYRSTSFKSRIEAQKYYNRNEFRLKNKYRTDHKNDMLGSSKDYVNDTYGYPIANFKDNLWILGKKKHAEYTKHRAIYDKVKNIFSKMKYTDPTDNIETELAPIISYFLDVIEEYSGKNKNMRKMRYASYYNLAQIYYYLDNVEKTKEYAQKLIDNDYDKKDGKRFIKNANRLQERFNANKVTSRHFDILTEDLTDEISQRIDANYSADILAYLITKSNDTIQAIITADNTYKIGYGVDLEITDTSGNKRLKHYSASDCIAMALTNEDQYKVIEFDEVNKGAVSSGLKFVKVLFESEKIDLYLFNEKELVLKFATSSKGKSTLSSDFAFGFNKKLSSYITNCPNLLERTANKDFKNNADSLLEFCKDFSKCN